MIIEEKISTEVKREYDVAVCGGGFAGISAALAAARQGKKVVLFEKLFMLGGLATAGLVTIYLPLWVLTNVSSSGYNGKDMLQKL